MQHFISCPVFFSGTSREPGLQRRKRLDPRSLARSCGSLLREPDSEQSPRGRRTSPPGGRKSPSQSKQSFHQASTMSANELYSVLLPWSSSASRGHSAHRKDTKPPTSPGTQADPGTPPGPRPAADQGPPPSEEPRAAGESGMMWPDTSPISEPLILGHHIRDCPG